MDIIRKLGYAALVAAVVIGITGCNKEEQKTDQPAAVKASDKPLDHPAH